MSHFERQVQGRRLSARALALTSAACVIGASYWIGCAESNPPPPTSAVNKVPPIASEPVAPRVSASSAPVSSAAPMKVQGPLWLDDIKYLEAHGAIIQLETAEHGVVAVSPKYQGRVMTSAVARDAMSLGYINRSFIDSGKTDTAFDNYGGEDRFWLGPEGGQFALFFERGKSFDLGSWHSPAAIQEGEWAVTEKTPSLVVMTRSMKLTNYAGTAFELEVKRTVRVLTNQELLTRLHGVTTLGPIQWVGFETSNQITNKGSKAWSKKDGLLSIWILGMFNPRPDMNVVIPFETKAQGPTVNDSYFGTVPSDRLHVYGDQGFLTFKCDAQLRSKIGLGPNRAKNWLGSYSESATLLTLVNFDKVEGAKDYVNSMWEQQKEPFSGDVVNSYNDGPLEAGKPGLGGFYELETSSPAAALKPGQSLTHVHRTLHFVGKRSDLDPLAKATLGVSLDRVLEVTQPAAH